jgi:hypothetical protein
LQDVFVCCLLCFKQFLLVPEKGVNLVILGFVLFGGAVFSVLETAAGVEGLGIFLVALMIPGLIIWGGMSIIGGAMNPSEGSVAETAVVVCIGMPLVHIALSRLRYGIQQRDGDDFLLSFTQAILALVWIASDLTFMGQPYDKMFEGKKGLDLAHADQIDSLKSSIGMVGLAFGFWAFFKWSRVRDRT